MRLFALPEKARFSNKEIFIFILSIIFETLTTAFLGIADTTMVSHLGETAVAGVALVNRIDNFAKQFFIALAQGGCVVLSQYIGAEDNELSKSSLKNNIRIVTGIGLAVMLVMVLFKNQILNLLYSSAEPEVIKLSSVYFSLTAFSYPFCALYYSCTNAFRVMGESKIPFVSTFLMMIINLALKYIFIFKMNMGVMGAGLSTLLAFAISGIILVIMLTSPYNKVVLEGIFKFDFNKDISKRILKISVPNGIEQGMFQLGALLIAGLVSSLGTSAIAADQIARNLAAFMHSGASGFVAAMMMIVGQCLGAKDVDEAKMYTKHILKLDYIYTFINGIIFLFVLKALISVFEVSDVTKNTAFYIMVVYSIGSMLFYPLSFALHAALRAAGDTKFVMVVSSASMFLFRIGAAYIFVYAFKLGILGTWFAMVSDWVIRMIIFIVRYRNGKWQKHKVI